MRIGHERIGLTGGVEGAVADPLKRRIMSPTEQVPFSEWMAGVSDDRMRDLARRTKEAGVWNVPTVFLWESLYGTFAPESPTIATLFSSTKRAK